MQIMTNLGYSIIISVFLYPFIINDETKLFTSWLEIGPKIIL